MSVVMLFGAGALIGLVALTVVVIVTLLTEEPEPERTVAEESEPERTVAEDRSVL